MTRVKPLLSLLPLAVFMAGCEPVPQAESTVSAVTVDLPTADGMVVLATREAETLWGEVHLVDAQPYFHPDGAINSWVYVFSRTDEDLDRTEAIELLVEGQLDTNSLVGIELGARVENPPIMAYWTGVPREYALLARQQIRAVVSDDAVVTRRHGSSMMPVFETEAAGESRFFHPNSGRVFDRNPLVDRPERRRTERGQKRLARNRASWARTLAAQN